MTTAVQVQYRRGAATQVAGFTGAAGEMVVDTTNNRVVVQDGATAGGWPAAKLSEAITNTRTAVADANYTALATDRSIAYTAITAARTVTLPASSSYPTGTRLTVFDESGACSATNTITLSPNGSDTIDGASSAQIKSAYGYLALQTNAAGKWTIVDQAGASGGVSSLNTLSGALSIAATDGTAVSASGTIVSVGGPGGMVNKFRNGTMDVWQRGTSSLTATTSGSYTADGWIVTPTGASVTASQAAGRLLTKNSLQVTGASSATDVQVAQRIESLIAAAFCSQIVTVQAQIYNNTGAAITPTLTIKRPSTQDGWSGTVNTDVNAASLPSCANGAWTSVSYTFSANAASYNGLEVIFDFGNNFSSSSKSIQITECDMRVTPGATTGLNSNPPPPELRHVAAETAFCQRYYWQWTPGNDAPVNIFSAFSSTQAWGTLFDLPVTMRAAPTCAVSSASHFGLSAGSGMKAVTATDFTNSSVNTISTYNGWTASSASFTTGQAIILATQNASAWISASAEL
jgi:hypothetical protein